MAKILLVEPRRILQQAITLPLSYEHEVETRDSITASEVVRPKEWDLVILDVSLLKANQQLTEGFIRAVQNCPTPTLWLEEEDVAERPKRDRFLALKIPLEKASFESSVRELLNEQDPTKKQIAPGNAQTLQKAKGTAKKMTIGTPQQENFGFIELVDVVEESPTLEQDGKKRSKPQ